MRFFFFKMPYWRLLICLIVIAYRSDGKYSSNDKQPLPKREQSSTVGFPTKRYKRSTETTPLSSFANTDDAEELYGTKSTTLRPLTLSSNIVANCSTTNDDNDNDNDLHSTDSPSSGRQISEIGTSFFYDLVAVSDVYVDKTLFVREFLNCPDKVVLITRPGKWGKTINMDMLKTFLAISSYDKNTNTNNNTPSSVAISRGNSNYKLFAGGEIRTEDGQLKKLLPLKIARHDDIMKHQGRYPVIWATFKNIEGRKYEEIENGLRKRIRNLYLDHSYLDEDDRLNEIERRLLRSYMSGEFDAEDLKTSLFFLSRLLKNHFDRKVLMFIDDYDTPIKNVYVKVKQQTKRANKVLLTKVFKQTYALFRGITNEALQDNEHLKKALITGTVRLDIDISGLNNLSEYSLLDDDRFGAFYGFDQTEVDELIEKTGGRTLTDRLEIQRWYRGFHYGGRRSLYNPWSIMQCLKSRRFEPYWTRSDRTSDLIEKKLLRHTYRQDVRKIMFGGTCTVQTGSEFDFQVLDTRDGVFNALLRLGYLNPTGKKDARCNVTMPNEEIRLWYVKQVGGE